MLLCKRNQTDRSIVTSKVNSKLRPSACVMARGRGSASGALAAALLVIIGLLVATSAPLAGAAASHMVGDNGGWKLNVDGWAKGRTFRAGDQLGESHYR